MDDSDSTVDESSEDYEGRSSEIKKKQPFCNFKDCYENYCGDDLTFLFSLYPKIEKYKYEGSSKNICFLCRRAQNFSKMIPGIGINQFYDRNWIQY